MKAHKARFIWTIRLLDKDFHCDYFSFLESISDYSYVAGQDIVTDLLMCLARSLTFVDLVGFLAGSDAVMTKLQQPLKDFLRARLGIRTSDDIEVGRTSTHS